MDDIKVTKNWLGSGVDIRRRILRFTTSPIDIKVADTSGLKCSYSLRNFL